MGLSALFGGRDSSQRLRKITVWNWPSPWFSMYPSSVIHPSSLIGRHIGKSFTEYHNNLLIFQHIQIVGCFFFVIYFKLSYCMLCVISGSPHSVFLEILTSLGVFRASARIEFSIISVFCFSPTRWRLHISSYLYYSFPYVCQACLERIFSQCTLHICWLFYFIFRVRIGIFYWIFYCIKMSSHQASSKPRSSKCRHFCFPFDLHNYCPTCRESGKEDNSCVTNLYTCNVCSQFTEEQKVKIKNRRRYTRKQKSDVNTHVLAKMIWICWAR